MTNSGHSSSANSRKGTRGRNSCEIFQTERTDIFFEAAIDFIEDNRSQRFFVYIEHSGKYEFTINRGPVAEEGRIYVSLNDKTMSKPIDQRQTQAIFPLPAGKAKLNVWV